ncbi:MAG TPA: ammonium transporter [Clostridiales bacterium]|nr:ammonium transporter [Clostridiales bacterium]
MNSGGDTAFILICAMVVLLMTPAVALLYAGLAERKFQNTMLMQVLITIPLISVLWALVGFSLAFGGNALGGLIGNFDYLLLRDVFIEENPLAPGLPFVLFFVLQATVAIITPALICGALVKRLRFLPYLIFIVLWSLLVYCPVVHWVWGNGFLSQWGYIDFAGGVPVHMIAGFSALGVVLVLGNAKEEHRGTSSTMTVVVAMAILWAGWFCFNSGSALAANGLAAMAVANTLLASGASTLIWLLLSYRQNQRQITVMDIIFGALAGLVVSSPLGGYVSPWAALVAGALAGAVCYGAMKFRLRRNYDDTLDVWAFHGVGGLLGALLVGFFANPLLSPGTGLLYGGGSQLLTQVIGVLIAGVYCFIVTIILVKIINAVVPFRIENEVPQFFGKDEDEV